MFFSIKIYISLRLQPIRNCFLHQIIWNNHVYFYNLLELFRNTIMLNVIDISAKTILDKNIKVVKLIS